MNRLYRAMVYALPFIAGSSVAHAQQATPSLAGAFARARDLLAQGALASAESAYTALLPLVPAADAGGFAELRFGLATVHQQMILTDTRLGGRSTVRDVIDEYLDAERAAPARYRSAGANNRAILLRHNQEWIGAALAFTESARDLPPLESANAFVEAGRSWQIAKRPADAARAYRQALMRTPDHTGARLALLEASVAGEPIDSILALVRRWRADSSIARAMTDRLLTILVRDGVSGQTDAANDVLLVELAWNLVTRRLTPTGFGAEVYERLGAVVRLHGSLQMGANALLLAYRPPRDGGFREPDEARWWKRRDGPDGFHAGWSATLRSLGDHYARRAETTPLARQYYLASIDIEQGQIEPWGDRRAIMPLGVILARSGPDAELMSDRLASEVERISRVQSGQGADDRLGEITAIRSYHATVGRLFSQDPSAARRAKADRHVESMRRLSDSISARTGTRPRDPPSLIEDLAASYERRGRGDSARMVKEQLVRSLSTRGLVAAANGVEARVQAKTAPPGALVAAYNPPAMAPAGNPVFAAAGGFSVSSGAVARGLLRSLDTLAASERDTVERLSQSRKIAEQALVEASKHPHLSTRVGNWRSRVRGVDQRVQVLLSSPPSDAVRGLRTELQAFAAPDASPMSNATVERANAMNAALGKRLRDLGALHSALTSVTTEIRQSLSP